MRQLLLIYLLALPILVFSKPKLYVQTFGQPKATPIIFLHGGPGYNAASFEQTTALALANQGFYVVVYDRRGEGRSEEMEAQYTWEESLADLNHLYQQLKLKKAILLGHSFGGMLGIQYAQQYPKKVQGLVLVGAPVHLSATFENIRARCTTIYEAKEDATNLYYMSLLKDMNPASMEYASYCFAHAMQNGFYSPASPSEEAQQLYALFATNPILKEHASKMTQKAPLGFWKQEQYTSTDLTPNLQQVITHKVPVLGLYGQEDGLFSKAQVEQLGQIIGFPQLHYWENCSHNVFIDQQSLFLSTLQNWCKTHE